MRRHMTLTLSAVAAFAAGACAAPMAAHAAQPLPQPIVINPSSGCGLLTAYTAGTVWPAWSGAAPSCGSDALTLAFNQGDTPPPAISSGVRSAGSALLAWFASGVPGGARIGYQISAPPGMTINKVVYYDSQLQNIANGHGWIGFTYWNGGTAPVHPNGTAVDASASGPLNSSYWGIELRCVESACVWPGEIQLSQITVYAAEAQGPNLTPAADPASLWNQSGHWIWNAPGNDWALPVAAGDSSGICSLSIQAGGVAPIADSSLPAPTDSSWQECRQQVGWTPMLDTRDYVGGAGPMPVTLQATNAAGVSNAPTSQTLNVDNDPVSVSLSTPDDSNPTVWINHAVTVDATPSSGPSGLGGMNCGVNGAAAQSYPAGGLSVNGDGVKTVSCTAWNNAVDPQGNHNVGTSSVTVHIDEAPPVVSLEPANPNDPTGVVADASDSESGVAGGSIDMAPAGTSSWTALPTTFTGSQLVAHFDDAGLHGLYAFQVRSCDNVGNCTSTGRTVMLPVRTQAVSEVSLGQLPAARCPSGPVKADAAPRSRHERRSEARVAGASGLSLADAGLVRSHVPADPGPTAAGRILGGNSSGSLARSLSHPKRPAGIARATSRRGEKPHTSCGTSAARLAARARVPFGRAVRLNGLLISSAGVPLPGQPVTILTAPDNASNAFTEATAVTTGLDGSWTATLPPGPSRVIEASYPGSPTILPASGYATEITPAKIEITHVTPDRTPWGRRVRITGRVLGGYIPASSKLLRLDLGIVGIPGLSKIQGIPNVSPDGTFTTTYQFAHYQGVVRFWLQVSSLAEADFPFAPARSQRVIVTVGVPAPTTARHRRAAARDRRRSPLGHRRREHAHRLRPAERSGMAKVAVRARHRA
jgi:hypothetical protein